MHIEHILEAIRKEHCRGTVVMGHHPAIIQSMLDMDFLSGNPPSVIAIVTGNRKAEKYFYGDKELLLPCYPSLARIPRTTDKQVHWMLNLQSGRRVWESVVSFFERFPSALGGTIFTESLPEQQATALIERFKKRYLLIGPSSVGLLVPGALKLGAIGGVDVSQMHEGGFNTPGTIAVGSTSGGMTNELIRAVIAAEKSISFAVAIGGDRFPILSITQLFLMAQADKQTKAFVYFGELGGTDEYELIALIKAKRFRKPVVAYVAGLIDEAFKDHVQFGHAKALVQSSDESARAKREALRAVGVTAPDTFPQFLEALHDLPASAKPSSIRMKPLEQRQKTILSTRQVVEIKKSGLRTPTFVALALEALLGEKPRSNITIAFTETVFSHLIDHGGNVSGAVNTMITARAGKDLVCSLASGLLTIGSRFGGAVNAAALTWLCGVSSNQTASEFVEAQTRAGQLIPGIGHKKYRVGIPDPRVETLSAFAKKLKKHPHYDFARGIEKVTTAKSGSLILNVDGVIGALLLDLLTECEGCSKERLQELADAEFFNAFFVIPRTVGFIAHFLEQKQNDEGLFRLPDELLFVRPREG